MVATGADPMALSRGISKAVDAAMAQRQKLATPINEKSKSEIKQVATIAGNNDPEIGNVLADAFTKVRGALSKLAAATPRYQCQECGFSSQRLLWQCPSCRDWETQRPASRVQFDTVLQHSFTK